jgi:hypothetical protein
MRFAAMIPAGLASLSCLFASPVAMGAANNFEMDSFSADLMLASNQTRSPDIVASFLPPILRGDGARVIPFIRGGDTLLRYVHYPRHLATPDAVIALESGSVQSLAQARRRYATGFNARRLHVRGQAAVLFTSRVKPALDIIVWRERGRVRELSSGTTNTVSLGMLKAVAAKLDLMERAYVGALNDPNGGPINVSAVFAVAQHSVTLLVGWSASCARPDGTQDAHSLGSEVQALQIPRHGNTFSAENLKQPDDTATDPWMTQVSGVITPDALQLSLRATLSLPGVSCDTGLVTGAITGSGR